MGAAQGMSKKKLSKKSGRRALAREREEVVLTVRSFLNSLVGSRTKVILMKGCREMRTYECVYAAEKIQITAWGLSVYAVSIGGVGLDISMFSDLILPLGLWVETRLNDQARRNKDREHVTDTHFKLTEQLRVLVDRLGRLMR